MMRYLLISFFCLSIISCKSLGTTRDLTKEIISKNIENPYFSSTETDYVYKAKVAVGKNNFGGLLIIKKIAEAHHRVVFTTEFGNKIFDFEFIKSTFKVNSILKELDRKIVLNALKKDYGLLINEQFITEAKFYSEKETVYQAKAYKNSVYFVFDKYKKLLKIVKASKKKEKMTITFQNIKQNKAENIRMEHHNFNMITVLNYINN